MGIVDIDIENLDLGTSYAWGLYPGAMAKMMGVI